MKRIFLVLFPLVAFADMNTCYITQEPNGEWRIVCEGNGLEYEVVDVTNNVYLIEDCEILKSNLISSAEYIETQASLNQQEASKAAIAAGVIRDNISPGGIYIPDEYMDTLNNAVLGANDSWMYSGRLVSAARSLKTTIEDINCGSCSTNSSGGGGSCCDFGPIIERLIVAEKQRIAITNRLSFISKALYAIEDDFVFYDFTRLYNLRNGWQVESLFFPDEEPYSLSSIVLNSAWDLVWGVSSLNNFSYGVIQPAFTALQSPPTLFYFDSSVEERDYYTYLTNYYFGMVRKDREIPSNYRTNWFARIETLLAALVFQDGGKTNYLDSSQNSMSNSFQQVYDDFEEHMTGISDFSTEQMKLVSKVQSSMYNNLISFSRAFEDAALPSTVQIINVHKDSGTRSLSSDSVDVSLDVDGKLLDFIEILRSASTLCWVFLGLWMMFKFSVWTVKKIYVLIRYIIDFFNMIIGGK